MKDPYIKLKAIDDMAQRIMLTGHVTSEDRAIQLARKWINYS